MRISDLPKIINKLRIIKNKQIIEDLSLENIYFKDHYPVDSESFIFCSFFDGDGADAWIFESVPHEKFEINDIRIKNNRNGILWLLKKYKKNIMPYIKEWYDEYWEDKVRDDIKYLIS